MRVFPFTLRRCKIASALVLTTMLLIAGLSSRVSAAQESDSKPTAQLPPEPPSPPATFQNPIPSDQLTFLNEFAGKMPKELLKDKRFSNLMKLAIPSTEYHYGRDMPLSDTVETLLKGPPIPIGVREGRYVMVASHGGPILDGKSFLWFDMQTGVAIGGVYFHPTNGEPTPTLAIYSRQLSYASLAMGQLPVAFQQDLAQWMLVAHAQYVSPRYFIPENGKKYVLLHDEDYCSYPVDTPPVAKDKCEELNADAADADVNAAYLMARTHNAANATAWMLDPEQVAWIRVRESTCGVGGFACRIRLSRHRTRVLIGPRTN